MNTTKNYSTKKLFFNFHAFFSFLSTLCGFYLHSNTTMFFIACMRPELHKCMDSSGGSQCKLCSQENWEEISFSFSLQTQDFSHPDCPRWQATDAPSSCPSLWPQARRSPSVPIVWPHFFNLPLEC